MNTNRHKYRWASFGATTSWDEGPPGSAGVPPAHVLAQSRPSPPTRSTGNGARTLLRPSPCRSPRQGGRVPHRRETERHLTGVHAGGTPALPGGILPSLLLLQGVRDGLPSRSPSHSAEPSRFVSLRGPSCHFVDYSFFLLFQISSAPAAWRALSSSTSISSTRPTRKKATSDRMATLALPTIRVMAAKTQGPQIEENLLKRV